MLCVHDATNFNKISPEFASRLTNLEPQHKVCLIVLLHTQNIEDLANKRQTKSERQAAIKAIQDSASQALENIIDIIEQFDKKQLHASEAVKAVMEDQSIYPGYTKNSLPSK